MEILSLKPSLFAKPLFAFKKFAELRLAGFKSLTKHHLNHLLYQYFEY